jgi:hypothetical protein
MNTNTDPFVYREFQRAHWQFVGLIANAGRNVNELSKQIFFILMTVLLGFSCFSYSYKSAERRSLELLEILHFKLVTQPCR